MDTNNEKLVMEMSEAEFDRVIGAEKSPVLVDFYAPWCGPCKMIAPLLDRMADYFEGRVRFYKVNVDEAPGLSRRFKITGVPTMMIFQDGKLRDAMVGFSSPQALVHKLETLAPATAGVRA